MSPAFGASPELRITLPEVEVPSLDVTKPEVSVTFPVLPEAEFPELMLKEPVEKAAL